VLLELLVQVYVPTIVMVVVLVVGQNKLMLGLVLVIQDIVEDIVKLLRLNSRHNKLFTAKLSLHLLLLQQLLQLKQLLYPVLVLWHLVHLYLIPLSQVWPLLLLNNLVTYHLSLVHIQL
jgi:hypothetical protein